MDEKGNTHIGESPVCADVAEAPGPSRRLYMIVLAGGMPGAMLLLREGDNWLGRGPENALQLIEPSVSRRHALLRVRGDHEVELIDQGSTNGTFLNNERLAPASPVVLQDGDRARFGCSVVLKFVCPDPEEEQFQHEMFERTVRDGLTGLYNRSYFLNQIDIVARSAARNGMGLAVLMLDIDRFKKFNDTYGHDAGDMVLCEVANVLRQTTRADDLVARYGGEEFILALPVPSLEHGMQRANLVRRALESRQLRLGAREAPARVTASIGVAFASSRRPRTSGGLISMADLNMLKAKETGRNRAVGPASSSVTHAESQTTSDGEGPLIASTRSATVEDVPNAVALPVSN